MDREKRPMTIASRTCIAPWSGILLAFIVCACSDGSGPTSGGETARLAGLVTGDALAARVALAGDGGSAPLAGVSIRLVSGSGEVLLDSATDAEGEFEIEAPAGSYLLEISLADGSKFTLGLELEAGRTLFVQGNIDTSGDTPVINAELFIDDDGDGVSDTGFTIEIRGREAGDPDSGEVVEGEDPDSDLDDEEEEVEDDAPATLADFEVGQKVFVKGGTTDGGFEADEVHGSSGNAGRSCLLSGEIGGVTTDADGNPESVDIFSVTVDVTGAHITGVRDGGFGLVDGVRADIQAAYDGETGELTATRMHVRESSRGRNDERIMGFLTAEPGESELEVCGVHVQVAEGAKITNGDGGDDGEE
jgi:hypothetical protein